MYYTEHQLNWVEDDINVLGIDVANDMKQAAEKNYRKIINKSKTILRSWSKRSLSLIGKIEIINTIVSSRYVYAMSVLPRMSDKMIAEIEGEFEKFIWNGHKPKIPLSTLKLSKRDGGLGLVDLLTKDQSLKAVWIKSFFEDDDLRKNVTEKLNCPVDFLLWRCNLNCRDIDKIMKTDDAFWKETLEAWCNFNFDPNLALDHRLWWNSLIIVDNKPVLWINCIKKGLLFSSQLIENGKFISIDEARSRYGLTDMQFNSLKSAILKEISGYVKKMQEQGKVPRQAEDKVLSVIMDNKATQKIYRNVLPKKSKLESIAQNWTKEIDSDVMENELLCAIRNMYRISNILSVRSFYYRLVNRAIITNIHLYRWRI